MNIELNLICAFFFLQIGYNIALRNTKQLDQTIYMLRKPVKFQRINQGVNGLLLL